ncbi:PilZ domain-containing protein [Megalodesulfovibrio gigas]|uniref:PilZ domain-containing protein n=1 Tax=Megalodesulfovibrio gigas (strain ATCC 19364 / DSM 1382 / NCIMB 9332 / VKM B-1759) TaxID=1121448 RepID=T2GBB8_MEGG1|nr:PilZ domain-containing protein [Megalodesulfovibrio gigas]AGW13563.1 hypothetical protein DGI_1751 [Megalodesulfovibrio gigas DSM 1382 = ATCC 19364]
MLRESECNRLAAEFHTFLQEYACAEECAGLGMPEDAACSNFVHYYKLVLIVLWSQALEFVFPGQAKAVFKKFMMQLQQSLPASQRKKQYPMLLDTLGSISGMLQQDQGVVKLAQQCVLAFASSNSEDPSARVVRLTRQTLEHLQRSIAQLSMLRDQGFTDLSSALAVAFAPSQAAAPPAAAPSQPPPPAPTAAAPPAPAPAPASPRPAPQPEPAARPEDSSTPAAIIVPLAAATPELLDLDPPPQDAPGPGDEDEDAEECSIILGDDDEELTLDPEDQDSPREAIPAPPPESLFEISDPPPPHLSHGRIHTSPPLEGTSAPPVRPAASARAARPGKSLERRGAERVNGEGLSAFINESARQLPLQNLSESGLTVYHEGWTFAIDQTISLDVMTTSKVLLKDVHCKVIRCDATVMACTFVGLDRHTQAMLQAIVKRLVQIRCRGTTPGSRPKSS